jgi:hypothetical protein
MIKIANRRVAIKLCGKDWNGGRNRRFCFFGKQTVLKPDTTFFAGDAQIFSFIG